MMLMSAAQLTATLVSLVWLAHDDDEDGVDDDDEEEEEDDYDGACGCHVY